jgi:hypothetical protein
MSRLIPCPKTYRDRQSSSTFHFGLADRRACDCSYLNTLGKGFGRHKIVLTDRRLTYQAHFRHTSSSERKGWNVGLPN